MRFYHRSQNSIFPITLRQLPLCSPKKTIIIWHFKQIKALYNKCFGAVLWNSLSKKKIEYSKENISGGVSFSQGSYFVEHMRIPKAVVLKVAFIWKLKSLFRSSQSGI